ncbi:MAG: Ig-like domain-containing protein, partial [Thioalkalivibrio sp.]|nr:Ig-like domain-containing protein [Thioalkalivibrio sp.]
MLGTAPFEVGAAALTKDGSILYGSTLDPGRFSWSSSAPNIATVESVLYPATGREIRTVTGVSEGAATIT